MEYHLTIKEYPQDERPRERLLKAGPGALSNAELLAILIRTGTARETAVELAHRVLNLGQDRGSGLRYLMAASLEELSSVRGIGPAKAAQIKAALELGRRLALSSSGAGRSISCPGDAKELLMAEMRFLDREQFRTLMLDTRNQVLGVELVSMGSLGETVVHPREVFKGPIKRSAAAIILAHNHPSGDPTPSREDILITRRIIKAGELLGIEVLDHLIIGDNRYLSFREQGIEWERRGRVAEADL